MSAKAKTLKSSRLRESLSNPGRALAAAKGVSGAVPYLPSFTKAEAREAVDENLGQRLLLSDFRSSVTALTKKERELLIDQAQLMLEQVFAHLPLKRALHGTEPIQRLRLLKLRHSSFDERTFHSEMTDIFTDLRDLHTNYVLPQAYASKFAFLPFRIEEFYDKKVRKFAVSWVSPVNPESRLKPGVVVTHWNGSPVELAVARNAEREAGSNPEARRARGVEALTLRWLGMSLPPDEDWVSLTFIDGDTSHEARFDWEVVERQDLGELLEPADAGWGIDLKTAVLHRARKILFDPQAIRVENELAELRQAAAPGALVPPRAETSVFPDVYPRFGEVDTPSGKFGYIRIPTFAPESGDIDGAVAEFARILARMPPSGLILDVRGNGGGYVNFGERLLQMLTPHPITPEPFHFLANALTYSLTATTAVPVAEWRASIAQAIEIGASFSQGFPLTSQDACNDVGQVYQGPVLLITDALCYSTTDIFAAGFQDHGIGEIIGIHQNTGAGGANVWNQKLLRDLSFEGNPFKPLPKGAGMRVAVRRSTRVGIRSGLPLEDLGVLPDAQYFLTLDDVLGHNENLIAFAAARLAEKPSQVLKLVSAGNPLQFSIENIDRIDVFVDGRPVASEDATGRTATIPLQAAPPSGRLRCLGFRSGNLVATTRA